MRPAGPPQPLCRAASLSLSFDSTPVSLCRFGSFEIFKPPDEFTGRRGPSCGLDEIRGQMMDYVIEMFYPEIQQNYPDRVERNVAFYREVKNTWPVILEEFLAPEPRRPDVAG